VSLAVMEPRTEQALLDVSARLTATPVASSGPLLARALERGGAGNPILYHAVLDVPTAGAWQLTASVQGPAGSGQVGFDLTVAPAPSLLWVLGPGVAVGLALLAWMVAGWRRARR
jgi:hypothetical protein